MTQSVLSTHAPAAAPPQRQDVTHTMNASDLNFFSAERDLVDATMTTSTAAAEEAVLSLEAKYSQQGINLETDLPRFELCALHLYRLSVQRDVAIPLQERARRLAMEMCCYCDGTTPHPERLRELDQFLQAQARRLAAALDL